MSMRKSNKRDQGPARVDSTSHAIDLCRRRFRQGSSVVEQGTHKPLVGSSNLPPGIPHLQID